MAFDHDLTLAVWRVARRAIDGALPPSAEELETLVATIETRVTHLAHQRGLADLDADALLTSCGRH